MLARKARIGFWSLLTLLLLLLSGGIQAAAGGEDLLPVSAVDVLSSQVPESFELQDVSVSTGEAAEGADEFVSAKYLGAGTRNEIRHLTFGTEEAAESFLRSLDKDSCSVRTLVMCASRLGKAVVAGISSSTCPHPSHGSVDRAETLLRFGVEKLAS